ncbi:signal recognition particle 14kD protein-domain-containing protein [Leucosporidium creatinivorum]|uniref:Signal recognition particle subunit SRP14 n=1 Tax=Leucosporidium creatinivorum TaxID=106004 RepID=A0A1Y2ESR7_9BASI|nr:signal recognition particle 14kD protein-domain-containing protein [Leucosporidium creatinivorum]
MLLSNQDFLKQLQDLFDARKSSGSVFLTEKRFTYEPAASTTAGAAGDVEMGEASGSGTGGEEGEGAAVKAEEEHKEYPCLLRATDGKGKQSKVKISTLIQPNDHETFSLAYGSLLKASLSSLRKKKKTKRKAAPSAAVGGSTFAVQLTKVVGPRRGAGVEKRRKLLRRREKEVKKLVARKKRDAER